PHFFEGQIDKKHEIKSGDLLISWSATLGAYIWKGEEAVLNQHIFKVESFINKKYHYYLMQNLISSLYSKTHGSGMVHVTKKVFDEIPVPLPNLKEQKRIADKV
ncbi:restriction endonuclease subunit S, partial [Kitasatospora sp. SC0581]